MPGEVTQHLATLDSGDPKAAGALLQRVHEELRPLAAHKLANARRSAGHD